MPTADLSVVIANYNHARYLRRALDAILAQSVRPREVVVIDDASDRDDSWAVIEGYARRDPIVRPVRHAQNRGVCATYNEGLASVGTEFVVLTAADDYVLPGFFEAGLGLLERHPQAGLVCGRAAYQIGDDGPVQVPDDGWPGETGYYPPADLSGRIRRGVPGHANICRRQRLVEVGGYLPGLTWYSDWFALLSIAFRTGVCHIPGAVAVTLLHPASYSAAGARDSSRNVAAIGAFLDRVTAPEFADVAPHFRRNGAATHLGPDLIRAAARRPDRWTPDVLGLLNGFPPDQYESLLADPDPAVRELAEFFLGPFWRDAARTRAERDAEVVHLKNLLEQAQAQVPPPGIAGKLRWFGGRAVRRLGRLAG